MPEELAIYITKYGYLAIFSLVFLQEIGVPNPVPNELVLLFSGYLAYSGILSFPLVFFAVVAADFIGTSLLYFIFYFLESTFLKKAPKWFPVKKVEKFTEKIAKKGMFSIYLGRLLPYARGYISVAAGLVRIPPKIFLITVFLSAVTWSGGYALAGRLLGKEWESFSAKFGTSEAIIITFLFIGIISFIFIKKNDQNSEVNNINTK